MTVNMRKNRQNKRLLLRQREAIDVSHYWITGTASTPPDNTLTEAPVFSCIDLINEPCFPIKLIACVEATNKRMEQNPDTLSPSISDNPETRLKTLITASIAGERGASGSSFPDMST